MLEVKFDSLKECSLGKNVQMNMIFLDPRLRGDDDLGWLNHKVMLNAY